MYLIIAYENAPMGIGAFLNSVLMVLLNRAAGGVTGQTG